MPEVIYRTCNLCEALCGLRIGVEDERIVSVGSDKADVFSEGYACPKGMVIDKVGSDPDRLRQPVARQPNGSFQPISWAEAFERVERELKAIRKRHGRDAIAFYQGNPSAFQSSPFDSYRRGYRSIGTLSPGAGHDQIAERR